MNYNTAKKLKDSGFPFKGARTCFACQNEDGTTKGSCTEVHGAFPYFPGLSELVEACGDRFYKLEYDPKFGFYALPRSALFGGYGGKHYPTPEEAVATLWISLNSK